MLIDFDKAFVNVHHSILHALILAANFLNDKEILDMMCQEVADRIKGKTPEEIQEEEEIRKENVWALNDLRRSVKRISIFLYVNFTSNVIPLFNVDGKTMTKVIQYWKKYPQEGVTEDQLKSFD
ncbi:hypothetical protein H5410_061789 [Solanum commersonii]|uniref:SKP1 component dimerisation domain-containing protein n=1 Tax=Solanum commersonii TaxID=4109 RepID=A0A9J5W9N1_SOLCO|nr:hypothetical protein H5410_061789 [Solanum commersonii]